MTPRTPVVQHEEGGAEPEADPRARAAIARVPHHMADAWNRGDGNDFAAPFSDSADFIAFEGTRLRGREEVAAFHRELFGTAAKGTQLKGGVRFVRLIAPDIAVMHAWMRFRSLPGVNTPGRDSMQLFVLTRSDEHWLVEAMQNSRQLTVQQMHILDFIARGRSWSSADESARPS